MDDVELGEAEPTTYLSSPSSESHIVEESYLRERHPDILSALSDDADVTVDDIIVVIMPSRRFRRKVRAAVALRKNVSWHSTIARGNRPSSEDQSHYIVTAPAVGDDQNFVLPTWQVIRPGHHRLGNVGAPADPIYIGVICFSQQTLEAPRWNVFHRLLTPPDNMPPPAPNLVGIAPVGRAGARNLLKVIDGPLLYTQEEREQEWIGFAAKNKSFNRHIYYDSGPKLLKCSAAGTIPEKSFRFTTHPRRCYVTFDSRSTVQQDPAKPIYQQSPVWWVGFYTPQLSSNERTPFSDVVTQPDTNLIEQGIVGGVDQPLGALAKIHRFHGFVGWTEMPFE
ncbi:hypothetical protein HOY80DRAFT_1026826 [Tuber brumale]|nr:hypothetical protein HOY80DRAFT_1026826 [Tuber brumale]